MKLSELHDAFKLLAWRVDQLVQGVAASEFDARVNALEADLRRLQAWTQPRAGGTFEVDIEPYLTEGGAPAFMRERAGVLLAAATALRNARQAQRDAGHRQASAGRDDLAVPLAAPLSYSGEELKKIQRVFKYMYTRRAYRKLATGEVMVQSLADGSLPPQVRTIAQLSKHNLGALRRALAPLSDVERELHAAFRGLPFTLKHATTAASWTTIFSSRLLFSLDSLRDWNIVVPTNSPKSDEVYKQDVDFTFFRVEVGDGDWESRFGEGEQQLRVVFDWKQLLDDGWVTLHDMLAPLGSRDPRVELRLRDSGELLRVSEPDMPLQGKVRPWIHWKWKHTFVGSTVERKVHILDEVFHGPDILEGMALSMLRDLRELPPLQQEAHRHRHDPAYWHGLLKSLFRVEAKLASAFRFEPEDVVRAYAGEAPALRAETGHASLRPD